MMLALLLLVSVHYISVGCASDNLPRSIAYEAYPLMNTAAEKIEDPSFLSKMLGNFLMKSLFQQEEQIKQENDLKQQKKLLKLLNKQNDKDFFRF